MQGILIYCTDCHTCSWVLNDKAFVQELEAIESEGYRFHLDSDGYIRINAICGDCQVAQQVSQ